MRIVLVEPEIPGNTGNIARLSAALGATLHLIKPLGFIIEDKYLKRAGLDYWHLLEIFVHENYEEFLEKFPLEGTPYFISTSGEYNYSEMIYKENSVLIFGKETSGLSKEFRSQFQGIPVRIPMIENARSLNLSNSVAVVAYEVMRQINFKGMV